MKFSQKEIHFIREVLHVDTKCEETDETVLEQIWEEAAEIEAAESNQREELSEVGKMAVALVTKLGNDSE